MTRLLRTGLWPLIILIAALGIAPAPVLAQDHPLPPVDPTPEAVQPAEQPTPPENDTQRGMVNVSVSGRCSRDELNSYLGWLETRVRQQFHSKLNDSHLSAFRVTVQPDGTITDLKLETPSGNTSYDTATEAMLKNANPVMPLPECMPQRPTNLRFTMRYTVRQEQVSANKPSDEKTNRLVTLSSPNPAITFASNEMRLWRKALQDTLAPKWNAVPTDTMKPVGLRITLDSQGGITTVRLTGSSGDRKKDNWAKTTVEKARSFGSLPPELQGEAVEIDLKLF